jgi:hypothetical protein
MKKIFLLILSLLIVSLIFIYVIKINKEIWACEERNKEMKNEYEERLEEYKNFLEKISKEEEKNISSKELLMFLKLDDTEKIKYKEGSFDCTGFAFELYKRAKKYKLNVGIVEINFENEKGHMLNVFYTYDKGPIFIDVTGREDGNGFDKIVFLKDNKYKTIIVPEKEDFIVCDFDCFDLIEIEPKRKKFDIFSEDFLNNIERCTKIYKECVDAYNNAVEEYNRGNRKYSYNEMERWYKNLNALEKDISVNKFLMFNEEKEKIKSIEIYQ